jgi:hypothetical protein
MVQLTLFWLTIALEWLACEQALWIELEPAGLVNKNTSDSVPITIYSVVNQMR